MDERALGPGTTIRFVLLIALLLVATATMTTPASVRLTGAFGQESPCFLAAGLGTADAETAASYWQQSQFIDAYRACEVRYLPLAPPWWANLAWTALLLAGSAVVFWAIPRWRSRRGRVVALATIDHDGAIRGAIDDSAARAGVARPRRVVVDPALRSTSAVVFGRTGWPTVCLHGGLVARRQSDAAGFRAVLLHEFAHIRNGDVTLTYATVALWRVYVGLVLLPYVALHVIYFPGGPWWPDRSIPVPFVIRNFLLAAVMVTLVYLARSDVLRSRELHADLAAVRWGADAAGWVGGTERAGGAVRRALRAFAELWHTHPRWDVRRAALFDRAALFIVRTLPILLTGIAGPLIHVRLSEVISNAGVPQATATQAAAVIAAAMVTGVAGIVLWRGAAHAVATGSPMPSGVRAGAWLGVGMAVAELVTQRIMVSGWLPAHPERLLVLILMTAVFAWWVTACAHLYLSVWAGRTIRPVMAVALVPAGVVLAAWLVWWQQWAGLLVNEAPIWRLPAELTAADFPAEAAARPVDAFMIATQSILTTFSGSVLALPAVTLLWLTPLLAWLIRPKTGVAQWMRAEAPALREGLPALRRILGFAALCGVVCWTGAAATMAYMHTWQPPPEAQGAFHVRAYSAWTMVALAVALMVAAVIAGVATSHHRLPITLITSGAGALIGLGGTFVLTASDGCVRPLNTLASSCHWRPAPAWTLIQLQIGPTLVLAVIAAVIGAALGSAVRALARTWVREGAPKPARGRILTQRLGVGVLCGAAVAITVAGVLVRLDQGANGGFSETAEGTQRVPVTYLAQALGATGPPSVAPGIRAAQVAAWAAVGGSELMDRYADEAGRLGGAYRAAEVDGKVKRSVFEPICTRIVEIAIDAERFFPVPDAAAQAHWDTFVSSAKKGGQNCASSFERDEVKLFLAASEDLSKAAKAIVSAHHRMNAVLREAGVQPISSGNA